MAKTIANPAFNDVMLQIEELKIDLQNPRIPTELFLSEEDAIRFLIDEYDVEELVQSILSSGWIDYEPLIVEESSNTVYEGNRRLVALRLIADPDLRGAMNYRLPSIDNPKPLPDGIRVRYVQTRAEARRFIAFKHINGPFKWDAYAKAKYAADWLKEGEDVEIVSKMLGDNHNTVRRLVAGYQVLEQAQERGFNLQDRSKKRFSFSHLYTAISRPGVRTFLGIDDDYDLSTTPVPEENGEQLDRLMSWLYGQESKREPAVILSQNPNLNELVRVIENKTALSLLISSRRLDRAFEEVEPPSGRFKEAMIAATKQCEIALGLSAYYDGEQTLLAMVKNLATTVRNLRDAMLRKNIGADEDL